MKMEVLLGWRNFAERMKIFRNNINTFAQELLPQDKGT
jgi:hypothetical protein